jgi:hypothetical protein
MRRHPVGASASPYFGFGSRVRGAPLAAQVTGHEYRAGKSIEGRHFLSVFPAVGRCASPCAAPPQAAHDFISWLRQVGSSGAQHPRAGIRAHHPSPPLPRPRPADLAAAPIAPQAEAASAAPSTAQSQAAHEQAEPTSPAAADNTRAEPAQAQAEPASPATPNTVQAASPAASNKAKPAVPIND